MQRILKINSLFYFAACLFFMATTSFGFSQGCEHTDQFSGWERIKANNSAGVSTSLDYVYYRIKRCNVKRPRLNAMYQNLGVCHPGAQVQVKAPDGMPADPKTGEITAGYLVLEFFSDPKPIEVLFTVRSAGEVFENDYVNIQHTDLKSIKMLLMDDVLARLGKGPAISGTAEKAIVFPASATGSKAESSKTPTAPSILFQSKNSSSQSTAKIASLSNKMVDMDEFIPETADQTKAPTKPNSVAEFIKAGMWSDMQKQIDTKVYELVPLDDNGNFLLIDKARIQSEQTDTDRIQHFYPGISYPKYLFRRHIQRRYRSAVMGVRG